MRGAAAEEVRSLLLLLLFRRRGPLLSALGILLSAKPAIGAREQAQSCGVLRIRFGKRFEIWQGARKIGLLNLRLRQSQSSLAVVRIHQQRGLELVRRALRVFELQVNAAQQQARGNLARRKLQA